MDRIRRNSKEKVLLVNGPFDASIPRGMNNPPGNSELEDGEPGNEPSKGMDEAEGEYSKAKDESESSKAMDKLESPEVDIS